MGDVNYEAIADGVKALLEEQLLPQYLGGIKIEVNPVEVGLSNAPEVGIFVSGEDPVEVEIGGGEPYETTLRISLLCGVTARDMKESARRVWELVNRVKAALHSDRTLKGTVDASFRGAIEFDSAQNAGFWSAATITLNARLMA